MNRIFLLFCFVVSFMVSESSEKIRVLLLSGKNNHDWKTSTPFLKKMYESTNLFDVEIIEEPETLTHTNYKGIDVVVSNWSSFPDQKYRWPKEVEKALLTFIKEGGGLVTLHAASTAFFEWPEFKQISTGAWTKETSHGQKCEAKVSLEDIPHPIIKGMANFSTFDELWMKAERNPDFKVLATAINENTEKAGIGAQPVISVLEYGKGRIVHNALGHEVPNMRNIGFQVLMLRGTEWAATGKVKQELPQELEELDEHKPGYSWGETDSTIVLQNGKNIVWRYNFREKHQKPHFNPVYVGRNNITCVAPDDHPWHAGQWFSWKYINEVNYWEFVSKREYRSEGTTEVRNIEFIPNKDYSAKLELEIVYHANQEKNVLIEKRIIDISAPGADGSLTMDYQLTFKALSEEVELNRTPILGEENGKDWGGYGGLSLRINQSFMDAYFISDSDNEELHASTGNWLYMGFTGIDGNKVGSQIIANPGSNREEAAWYITKNEIPFYYISPAYLFYKPKSIKKGDEFTLKYRINHLGGETSKAALENKYQAYKKELNQ